MSSMAVDPTQLEILNNRISIVTLLLERLQGAVNRAGTKEEIDENTAEHVVPSCGELDNCSICLEEMEHEAKVRKLSCGHCFHMGCSAKWLGINKSCPVCKLDITERRAAKESSKEDSKESSKEEVEV